MQKRLFLLDIPLFWLCAVLCVSTRAYAAPPPGTASKMFFAPGAGADEESPLSRAVESAVLQQAPAVSLITMRALSQQLDLNVMRACSADSDGACVTQFAEALDVDYILRPSMATLGDVVVLTLTLFDGRSAQLLAQAQRQAPANAPAQLLPQVSDIVKEVLRAGDVLARPPPTPLPIAAITGAVVGGAGLVGGSVMLGLAAWQQARYQNAELNQGDAGAWEGQRLAVVPLGILLVAAGAVLTGFAVVSLVRGE